MRNIGVVSTWNTRCGIAEYCAYLVRELRKSAAVTVFSNRASTVSHDEPFVRRCWNHDAQTAFDLIQEVTESGVDGVLIQYHYGFYAPRILAAIVDGLEDAGVRVIVVFHASHDPELEAIAASLQRATLNVVHQQADIARLAALGIHNVEMVPHAVLCAGPRLVGEARPGRFRIGAFGFLMAHKGYLQLMGACHLLRRHIPELQLHIYAAAYPGDHSERCLSRCRAYMEYLGCGNYVRLDTAFLEIEEAVARLQACDLLVFPYQFSAESASGAARIGLASRTPVMCTPLPIFADMQGAVLTATGTDPFALAESILEVYRNPHLLTSRSAAQERFLEEHSWSRVAGILLRHPALQAAVSV